MNAENNPNDDYAICAEWLKGLGTFANKDTPGWPELLAEYEANPCHPQDLCMRELASLKINPMAWLCVLSFAFSLQEREQ